MNAGGAFMVLGLCYGRGKQLARQTAVEALQTAEARIEATLDDIDRKRKQRAVPAPCTSDILCTREGVRHRAGCLGKPEAVNGVLIGLNY